MAHVPRAQRSARVRNGRANRKDATCACEKMGRPRERMVDIGETRGSVLFARRHANHGRKVLTESEREEGFGPNRPFYIISA
jgi:hypothetical protein